MAWTDYTKYLGPVGYGINKIAGKDTGRLTDYLDPGDLLNKDSADDVKKAGQEAQKYLQQLSDTAWQRQMQGLQQALGSMNSYNGILSQIYGVPTNYYDPSGAGGMLGQRPGSQPSNQSPSGPNLLPPPPSVGPASETRKGPGHF
jgi:hypothetical protein